MADKLKQFLSEQREWFHKWSKNGAMQRYSDLERVIDQLELLVWKEHRHDSGPGCTFVGDCDMRRRINKIVETVTGKPNKK